MIPAVRIILIFLLDMEQFLICWKNFEKKTVTLHRFHRCPSTGSDDRQKRDGALGGRLSSFLRVWKLRPLFDALAEAPPPSLMLSGLLDDELD